MRDCVVTVKAPSRLHFGLLAFGQSEGPQFGGVGLMIDSPGVEVRAFPSTRFTATGPHEERVSEVANLWATNGGLKAPPACCLQVVAAPPAHVGLGLGTQLALSVATALQVLSEAPQLSPAELACRVKRGQRSAVGAYGFAQGGLLIDRGKQAGESIAPPPQRIAISGDWRFVLIRSRRGEGLYGAAEHTAFDALPPIPHEVTAELSRELREELAPAAERGACDAFGESLYRYGRLAGECFAQVQGGPYNGRELARIVETLRSWGVLGVGQSSWGPTLFALTRDRSEAGDLVFRLRQKFGEEVEVETAAPSLRGAQVVLG